MKVTNLCVFLRNPLSWFHVSAPDIIIIGISRSIFVKFSVNSMQLQTSQLDTF
jgi:hypothetical protein